MFEGETAMIKGEWGPTPTSHGQWPTN